VSRLVNPDDAVALENRNPPLELLSGTVWDGAAGEEEALLPQAGAHINKVTM
jgi:hypothetical protein